MIIKLFQIDTKVGDFKINSEKIITHIKKEKNNPDINILVFPEMVVSGYPPLDLLDSESFIQDQLSYVDKIIEATKDIKSPVIFGYIEKNNNKGKKLYNSLLVCLNGKILFNYRKKLLPTYDIFDERRYFEPGKEEGIFHFNGKRIGVVICEDLWYQESLYDQNPAQELFMKNVDFIISINASPSVVKKFTKKIIMIKEISQTYRIPIAYVNLVGGNDDIVFDGNSFVINKYGLIIAQAKRFEEDILEVSVDNLYNAKMGKSANYYNNDAHFFYEQIKAGIKSYVEKCNFKNVVIALSGGIDSALVTVLAVHALGKDKVSVITMPSKYSSEGSYKDSDTLCKNLDISLMTFPINDMYRNFLGNFNKHYYYDTDFGIMEENLQARIRGLIIMSYSNRYKSLVLSTGNKSELSVGYCTIAGDMVGGLAPISDLYKTEVYSVAEYINVLYGKEIIPDEIIDKQPSAELAPFQKDSDSLPPYDILDPILMCLIEGDSLEEDEKKDYLRCVEEHIEESQKIAYLLNKAEFKRRQAAITIKVHSKAFGYGRRIPIAKT